VGLGRVGRMASAVARVQWLSIPIFAVNWALSAQAGSDVDLDDRDLLPSNRHHVVPKTVRR
jgi:hypothetical protein